jgi:hypothetical protein
MIASKKICLQLSVMFVIIAWGGLASHAWSSSTAAAPLSQSNSGSQVQNGSDSGLRVDILNASRQVQYETGGRNIFKMQEGIPPLKTSVRPKEPQSPPSSSDREGTPRQPTPFPIKYYGFANRAGIPKKVFLQQPGVDPFVAGQGDIVAHRYRVIQITQNSVIMEDVFTGEQQPLSPERERPR